MAGNLFAAIPEDSGAEIFEQLATGDDVSIERIVSRGHSSPADFWYEQTRAEWVLLMQGSAILGFEDGEELRLQAGDYVNIEAGRRHRVAWTDPDQETLWLAVHYKSPAPL
jgi:cupin 2 domain-containing protein